MVTSTEVATNCSCPVNFDVYQGCGHGCEYCYTRSRYDIDKIQKNGSLDTVVRYCKGERNTNIKWVPRDFPLRFGVNSDPLQEIDLKYGLMLAILKYMSVTQYPYIICSKGYLLCEGEYKKYLIESNNVIHISIPDASMEDEEPRALPRELRIKVAKEFVSQGKRVVVRIAPFRGGNRSAILNHVKMIQDIGVYGIMFQPYMGLVTTKGEDHSIFVRPMKQKAKEILTTTKILIQSPNSDLIEDGNYNCCGTSGLGWIENMAISKRKIYSPDTYTYFSEQEKENTRFAHRKLIGVNKKDFTYRETMEYLYSIGSYFES